MPSLLNVTSAAQGLFSQTWAGRLVQVASWLTALWGMVQILWLGNSTASGAAMQLGWWATMGVAVLPAPAAGTRDAFAQLLGERGGSHVHPSVVIVTAHWWILVRRHGVPLGLVALSPVTTAHSWSQGLHLLASAVLMGGCFALLVALLLCLRAAVPRRPPGLLLLTVLGMYVLHPVLPQVPSLLHSYEWCLWWVSWGLV